DMTCPSFEFCDEYRVVWMVATSTRSSMAASSTARNVGGTSQDSSSPEGHRRRTILNWVLAAAALVLATTF
ncbi:MAG TPA: hypothetical protein VFL67_07960, partial [Mycobacterium sp.]|nr:hypothetical protein [Mycobacterium sp.]